MSADVHNVSTYVNHGCRCEVCTQANTEYMRGYRARRFARRIPADFDGVTRLVHPDAPHGTADGYENFGCRCPECVRDRRERGRRERAAK